MLLHRSVIRRLLPVCLSALLLANPVLPAFAFTQSGESAEAGRVSEDASAGQACRDGEQYAKDHHSGSTYAFAGFLCGIFGFAAAALSSPKPPATALIGKSPDYSTMFSQCFEKTAKSKNTKSACIGWASGAAVAIAIISASGSSN